MSIPIPGDFESQLAVVKFAVQDAIRLSAFRNERDHDKTVAEIVSVAEQLRKALHGAPASIAIQALWGMLIQIACKGIFQTPIVKQ
jgi:hypothetical protein